MKLRTKILALVFTLTTLSATLSGCGLLSSFSPIDYVSGTIDAAYKGESEKYLKTVADATADSVQAAYENCMQSQAYFFIETYLGLDGATEEQMTELLAFYKKIYQSIKYDIEEIGTGKDTYTLKLTIYPIDLFEQCYDSMVAFSEEFFGEDNEENLAELADEEIQAQYLAGMLEICVPYADTIAYDDPQELNVVIEKNADGLYTISDDDLSKIDELLVNYSF